MKNSHLKYMLKTIVLYLALAVSLALAYVCYFRENPAYRVLSFAHYSHAIDLLAIYDALEQDDSKMAKEVVLISLRSLDAEAQIMDQNHVGYGLTDGESWKRLRSILDKHPLSEEKTPATEPKRRLIPKQE